MKFFYGLLLVPGLLFSQERKDLFIPVGPTDSLDALYFVPVTPPPSKGYPALIMVPGFGLDKETKSLSSLVYAGIGYVSLAFTVRGQGHSSGESTIMSVRERHDLGKVVQFVRKLPHIDTTAIGIIGGSQGGLHALWAAADGLPVKAVSADAITPHWASDMFMNGSIRRTLLLLLHYPGVRYAPVQDTLWNLVRHDDYDRLSKLFAEGRDIDTTKLFSAKTPLLLFLKWQDHYFPAAPGIQMFLRYMGEKELYVGTQGHFSDEVIAEQTFQYSQITGWFNHYLQGAPAKVRNDSSITISVSSLPQDTAGNFTWQRRSYASWPPASSHLVRFYLASDSLLADHPPVEPGNSALLLNDYNDPSYTFDMGFIEGFHSSRFKKILPQHALRFTSRALDSVLIWAGTPQMVVYVKSRDQVFPLHAQIYEVDSTGKAFFVNRINYTARHWKEKNVGVIQAEGLAHAHRFRKGSRIRVVFTNIDYTNRKMLGGYPFVLPVFHKASARIYFDKHHPSCIELPTISQP